MDIAVGIDLLVTTFGTMLCTTRPAATAFGCFMRTVIRSWSSMKIAGIPSQWVCADRPVNTPSAVKRSIRSPLVVEQFGLRIQELSDHAAPPPAERAAIRPLLAAARGGRGLRRAFRQFHRCFFLRWFFSAMAISPPS
jgi:hypothetical protein